MQAEFTIAMGAEDDVLEFPWSSPDPHIRYFDIKRQPELLLNVPEAFSPRELGEFLNSVNGTTSLFESVKCDRWVTPEMDEEESIFGAACKAVSYVDLVFVDVEERFRMPAHEGAAERLVELLRRAPEISAAVEIVLRRCLYFQPPFAERVRSGEVASEAFESDSGYSLTVFISGYGDDEQDAWQRWGVALKLVQHALIQMAAQAR